MKQPPSNSTSRAEVDICRFPPCTSEGALHKPIDTPPTLAVLQNVLVPTRRDTTNTARLDNSYQWLSEINSHGHGRHPSLPNSQPAGIHSISNIKKYYLASSKSAFPPDKTIHSIGNSLSFSMGRTGFHFDNPIWLRPTDRGYHC